MLPERTARANNVPNPILGEAGGTAQRGDCAPDWNSRFEFARLMPTQTALVLQAILHSLAPTSRIVIEPDESACGLAGYAERS